MPWNLLEQTVSTEKSITESVRRARKSLEIKQSKYNERLIFFDDHTKINLNVYKKSSVQGSSEYHRHLFFKSKYVTKKKRELSYEIKLDFTNRNLADKLNALLSSDFYLQRQTIDVSQVNHELAFKLSLDELKRILCVLNQFSEFDKTMSELILLFFHEDVTGIEAKEFISCLENKKFWVPEELEDTNLHHRFDAQFPTKKLNFT